MTPVLINSMTSVSTVLLQGRIKTIMNMPQTKFTTEKKKKKRGNNAILVDVAQGLESWCTHK